jgi:hypothetical protein
MANQSTHPEQPFLKAKLDEIECYQYYYDFEHEIKWEDGIKTRHGDTTRKAKGLLVGENGKIDELIACGIICLQSVDADIMQNLQIGGIYLNYYENGNMYTPNHKHDNTYQMVISLGETRKFIIDKKEMDVVNGDVILFGSQMHGIPKQPQVKDGRISIAVFMVPVPLDT